MIQLTYLQSEIHEPGPVTVRIERNCSKNGLNAGGIAWLGR